jgi:hypothetical protein
VTLNSQSVASYKLETGALNWRIELAGDILCSVRYSPDGAFVVAAVMSEVTVLGADSGLAVHTFTEQNMAFNACFDSTSTKLFVGAFSAGASQYVVDLANGGTKVHSFDQDASFTGYQASFDEADTRVAYDTTSPTGASSIVVRVLAEPEKRTNLLEKEAGQDVQVPKGFCADWLLVAECSSNENNTSEVTLVNCANKYEVATELTELLPTVLGTGFTAHSSVGWVPGAAMPTIHATVGSELVFVELAQFQTMTSDGCFPAKVLADLCGDGTPSTTYQPETISAIAARFPYCVNIRRHTTDGEGAVGDTVLHYCARKHRTGAVDLWLPLDGGVYTPVSSGEHSRVIGGKRHYFSSWTALHEAIARNETRMVERFIVTLTTTLNDVTASLVSDALSLMVLVMSHFVPRALSLLDKRLVRKENTIETHIYTRDEAFVSGRSRLYATEDDQGPGSVQVSPGRTSSAWTEATSRPGDRGARWGADPARPSEHILPAEPVVKVGCCSTKSRLAQVDIHIVQLKDLVGPPDTSAEGLQWSLMDAIEDQCDETVYDSTIMKAAVDFKWRQTEWWVKLDLLIYLVSLVIASSAITLLAWEASNPWEANGQLHQDFPHGKTTTDAVVAAMAVMELLLLMWECLQLVSGAFLTCIATRF